MPSYQKNNLATNTTVGLLLAGVLAYAFGSRPVASNTTFAVTGMSADGTTATLNVVLRTGYVPAIGDLLTVTGTTADGGAFNVSAAPLTGVNINLQTGVGTLSFLLATTQSQVSNAGNAYSKGVPVGEAIANNEASRAFALPAMGGHQENTRTITMQVNYPTAPGAATMTLQGSLVDDDASYSDLVSTATTTTDLIEYSLQNLRFVRVRMTGLTGTPLGVVTLSL